MAVGNDCAASAIGSSAALTVPLMERYSCVLTPFALYITLSSVLYLTVYFAPQGLIAVTNTNGYSVFLGNWVWNCIVLPLIGLD